MAIALDTHSNSLSQTTNSYSWTHTCTGSNLVLCVAVHASSSTATASTVTYNSVSMTKVTEQRNGSSYTALFYLVGPATGAHSVTVTFVGTPSSISEAVSITGASQTGQPDASNSTNGSSTTPSVAVTTVASNSVIIDAMCYGTTNSLAVVTATGANQTIEEKSDFGSVRQGLMSYTGPEVSAGSNTVSYSATSTAKSWAIVAASFSPAGGGTPFTWQQLQDNNQPQPEPFSIILY